MHNSGLIELLKKLNIKEIKNFVLYLESPLQDRGRYKKEVLTLFKYITKFTPDFDNPKLGKEIVYSKVFDNEVFKPGRIEKVMGELFKSLRLFLLTEKYTSEENEANLQIDFAQILVERGLNQKALNIIKTTYDELGEHSDTDSYQKRYKLSTLEYMINTQRNRWRDDLNITKTLRYLDLYYFSARIYFLNHYLVVSKISRLEAQINVDAERKIYQLLNIVPDESPSLFISLKIFQLYVNEKPDIKSFTELFDLLAAYEQKADLEELKAYYGYLRNYCTILIFNGHFTLWPVLHTINKDNLGKGYFYHNGYLTPGAYMNISNAGIKTGDMEWAEFFIKEHRNRVIGENDSEDYYKTVQANFLLSSKRYQEALDILPAASQHLEIHLLGRRIELKAYYELKSDLLFYKIDAFKMYISRTAKKILSSEISEMHGNFINLLFQLAHSNPGDANRKNTIIKRINEKELVSEREWLLEKARELS